MNKIKAYMEEYNYEEALQVLKGILSNLNQAQ